MKESDIRLKIQHALQHRGYWPRHHQDGRIVNGVLFKPEIEGIPDIEARHPKYPTQFIEVKAVRKDQKAFRFDEISEKQREYLDDWSSEGGGSFLAIGKIVPAGSRSKIHSILVFPWRIWKEIEEEYKVFRSAPYSWDLYEKKPSAYPELLDLTQQARSHRWMSQGACYELIKSDESEFFLPTFHPLAIPTLPKGKVPFYLRNKMKEVQ